MALKTADEYVESIEKLELRAHVLGAAVSGVAAHPLVRPSLRALAATYQCAAAPEYRDLMQVRSSLTGELVNRFSHIHQSPRTW